MVDLSHIETLLNSGKLEQAQLALRKLELNHLSRKDRMTVALIARQLRAFDVALRSLYPIIRAHRLRESSASCDEIIEYSFSAANLGSTREAETLLNEIENSLPFSAAYTLSQVQFREWNYTNALTYLEKFLNGKANKTNGDQLHLEFNYAIAVLFGLKDFERSRELMRSIVTRIEKRRLLPLRYDILLVTATSYFLERDWMQAERYLEAAEEVFGGKASESMKSMNHLWQCLIKLGRNTECGREASFQISQIEKIRDYFIKNNKPYFAKTCDFYTAFCTRDPDLFLELYFRTQREEARRHLCKFIQIPGLSIPDYFITKRRKKLNSGKTILLDLWSDIQCRIAEGGVLKLKVRQLPHRILVELTLDKYLRPNLFELFTRIYPDERYTPRSAEAKISNGIFRLRKELKQSKIPISVVETEGRYHIESRCEIILKLARPKSSIRNGFEDHWKTKIVTVFGKNTFTAAQFAREFQLTRRSARYQIHIAIKKRLVKRLGKGRSSSYHLTTLDSSVELGG